MDSINLLLQPKATRGQTANLSMPVIKNTSKLSSVVAVPTKEDTVVFLSQEVKKLLEEKKEAEKKKMQEAIDKLREKSAALKEIENSKQNNNAKKIAEIKERVKQLLEMMRQCLLFGDKQGAALIAKEAAQLAKQLKALKAESGGGGENISVPNINLSDESAESSTPSEDAENINGEEMNAGAEAEAAAQAQAPQNDTSGLEETEEGKESEQAEEVKEERKLNQVANELQGIAMKLVEKHESGSKNDSADKQEIREIIANLRAIMSMAKQVLKQKTSLLNNESEKPHMGSNLQAEFDKAEKNLEEAIKAINI